MEHFVSSKDKTLHGQSGRLNLLESRATRFTTHKIQDNVTLTDLERDRLKSGFGGGYRYLPIELFMTDEGYFVFDAKNVHFLKVDRVAFDMLSILRGRNVGLDELIVLLPQHSDDQLRQAYRDLLTVQADNLLVSYHFQRALRHDNSQYEKVLSERMEGFTVFTTTECNLGCSYCIYGGQYKQHEKLSQVSMSWNTLKNTMKFLHAHSRKSPEIRLDFFGGEPLIAFKLIKRGVEYLKSIITPDGQKVAVTISSNGTIITHEILDFLILNNVYLQFSLDSTKTGHDRYRKIKGNKQGSFERIIKNLQKIYDRSPKYFRNNLRLKGVITPEALENKDGKVFKHPLVQLIVSEGHYSFVVKEPYYDLAKDSDHFFNMLHTLGRVLLRMEGLRSDQDIVKKLNVIQAALYHDTFGRFFNMQITSQVYFNGEDSTPFTKGCLTGYKEGAVSGNGDIFICHKSAKGENLVIGNVNEGVWYYEKMKDLNTILHLDWTGCTSCYLQKVCDLCFEKLNGDKGRFAAGISNFCEFNCAKYQVIFDYMLQVTEKNPELWQYIDSVIKDKMTKQDLPREDAEVS